ncbi:YceD family protein [Vagococcus carniphilus]|uniref:YceD family protein n=1 Tax=Vagococcus carniphilus TaxID=218144 RepID=A0A430AUD4_9ENTE|nr:YceD family protein [Vagococcus carniphilus]MDT2814719.1 YceD family protein [Vagococcus carniphilus]MDT2831547.1 YceD family protein [Vagococcus carniphilus]MDT2832830.1 YceD family protein [Vagococcus carniphilus]MDT2840269.1 YceD family protein [Vagococcus carniphilus]MDT2848451.1 YceD family protein [Vagococcus carniphilus]
MKWALAELNKYRNSQITFEETIDLEESLKSREPSILSLKKVDVNGFIQVDSTGYLAHMVVNTVITLPSSRSLEPVDLPLSLTIDEEYMTEAQINALVDVSEEDKQLIMPLEKDLIDLTEAVEDYILLNLPLQVLTKEEQNSTELPKGDFWQVLSEDDMETSPIQDSEQTIDPRLAKLSELLVTDDEE